MKKGPKYKRFMFLSTAKNSDKAEADNRYSQPHEDQKTNETGQYQKYSLSSR